LFGGLIERLPRHDFHVSIFSVGCWNDATVSRLRGRAEQYVAVPANIPAARELILRGGLDLLFFPDIGMEPVCYALAMSRLARVQCATWGHPVTTGLPTVDYFVSSRLLEPDDAGDHYTERLVRLATINAFCAPPRLRGPAQSRADLGLPEKAHLYLCPQSLFKLHPEFDDHLAQIVMRDPQGLLVFLEAPHPAWQELLVKRWAARPERIDRKARFLPRTGRDAFLHVLRLADVILDPTHFGGGKTSYQALGLGVPVVTQPSRFLRGRITAALYQKMGWRNLIAPDRQTYVELAVKLASDADFRSWAASQIAQRQACLFEEAAAVEQFASFLRQAGAGDLPAAA